jgi:endoglycosylceramidase
LAALATLVVTGALFLPTAVPASATNSATTTTATASASTSPPRYATNGLWVTDAQGRDLFLRGVDVSAAEYTPTDQALPWGPADFVAMRAAGVTVVRLPIAWALIEPAPGHFDQAAIDRAVQIVDWAGAAGLRVVLDMHQYLWTACFGGLGIPTWAVPNCPAAPPTNLVQQEADILIAENAFWKSPALQADFAQAWVRVARAVGQPYFLLGYDLLNEPGPGLIPNELFEQAYLAPFYRAVGRQLRAVDPGSLLFVEPSILNGLVNGVSQFLGPIGLSRLVYEPHQYGAVSLNPDGIAGLGAFDLFGPAQFLPDLTLDVAVAQRMGAAIWLGEWGAINPVGSVRPTNFVEDDLTEQDQFMLGSAYWSYDSSLAGPNAAIGAQLTRVVPDTIAGTPRSIATGTAGLTLTWLSDGGQTLISYPVGCVPVAQVVSGTASTSIVPGDYLAATAPPGRVVTLKVTC